MCSSIRMIATGSGDNSINIFAPNVHNGEVFVLAHTIKQAHDLDVNCVTWHPHEHDLLASAGDDQIVNLWKVSVSNIL